ncbi:MAG: hypothetical protein AB7K24_25110, partial [Gemmataceae bacterium]
QFTPNDFTTTPLQVFADVGRQVTALTTFGSNLIAGRSDGSVSILTSDLAGQFSESAFFADASLDRPSALQVIGDEVYLTDAGSSLPLVIGLGDFLAIGDVPLGGLLGEAQFGQVTTLNAIDQARLSLVATLLDSYDSNNLEEDDLDDNADAVVVGLTQNVGLLGSLLLDASALGSGTEEEEPIDEELVAEGELIDDKWIQFVIGVNPALVQLLRLVENHFRLDSNPTATGNAISDAIFAQLFRWLSSEPGYDMPTEDWTIWSELRAWTSLAAAPPVQGMPDQVHNDPALTPDERGLPDKEVPPSLVAGSVEPGAGNGAVLVDEDRSTGWYWLASGLLTSTLLVGWWRRRRQRSEQ